MRISTALLASLALAPALTAPAFTQDRAIAADPMASLVPTDAFFVARISSYDDFQAMAREISGAFAPGEDAPNLAELIPIDVGLLSKDKPMTMAASLRASQPVVTLILPALDPAALVAAAEGQTPSTVTRTSGSYVGISQGSQYEVGSNRLLNSMQPGQVAMRIDLAPVMEAFGPMIDMGMEQMRMMIESEASNQEMPMGMNVESMLDFYFDGFDSFRNSAETIDMGLSLRNGMLTMAGGLDIAEGSDMAGFGSTAKAEFASVTKRLGSGGMSTMLFGIDYADYDRLFGGMMGDILAMYPESMRSMIQTSMNGYVDMLKESKPGAAMRLDMRQGMEMALVIQAKENASALLPKTRQMLQSFNLPEMGYSVTEAADVTVASVPGIRSEMTLDVDAMVASMGEEMSEAMETADLKKIMEVMYGGDTVPMWYGAMDKFLLGVIGNGEGLAEKVVANAKAADAAPAPMLAWAMEQVGGRTPSMAVNLDFATLLRQIEPIVKQFDETAESLPEGLPASVPIAQYFLTENLRWSMGARMPLAPIAKFVSVLQ